MTNQTFEIIDGVYSGPEVWEGYLDLREYKDTLTSLGVLKEVRSYLHLEGCTSLTSLGSLTKVGGWLQLRGCTSLISLGSLEEVGAGLDLDGSTSLVSLGSLNEVGSWADLRGCTSLTSLGDLKKTGSWTDIAGCTSLVSLGSLGSLKEVMYRLRLSDNKFSPFQEVQEKIHYYSHLPLHEALNALHTKEVQEVPLYKNSLLKTLLEGEVS